MTSQIAIALVLAIVVGILLRDYADFVNEYIKPLGSIFLNLLRFVVVPLVLFSIMAGILSMNDESKVGPVLCHRLYLNSRLYRHTRHSWRSAGFDGNGVCISANSCGVRGHRGWSRPYCGHGPNSHVDYWRCFLRHCHEQQIQGARIVSMVWRIFRLAVSGFMASSRGIPGGLMQVT